MSYFTNAFSALTLLVGRQEGHPACKNRVVGTGVVICLQRGADLHMAQLMSLPLTVSCFSKIQIGFTFLVPAHLRSPGKRPLNGCVCVCVCVRACVRVCVCELLYYTFIIQFAGERIFLIGEHLAKCLQCFDTVGWVAGRASGL